MRIGFLASLLVCFLPLAGRGENLALVRDGRSSYSIVTSAKCTQSEWRGAAELQRFIQQMSGARLPIINDDQPLPAHAILVGRSRHTDSMHLNIDLAALGPEGFVLRTRDGRVIVMGSGVRGAMYGCTTLLEKLGVRWFTPRVTYVPRRATIELPELDERQVPDFEYREVYIAEALQRDWAARLRTNGQNDALDESTGGKIRYSHFVHTFDELVPRSEFATHPEYFPLINGKRTDGYVQRCLSNPQVLRLAIQRVRQWMRQDPGALIYSVSQNDNVSFCRCDACRAIEARYGGKHSGLYLWFVNQVAQAIEFEHPDKLIDTLAYQFTEEPPIGIRPRHNVRVRLCPISVCEAHPYEQCSGPHTIAFVRNLRGWSKLTDSLYIWHYNIDFAHYLMPFPDFAQFPDSIRLYKRSGVKGIFFEGASSPGSSDADLHAYVMAHLLWDSRQAPNALIDEWMHGVYRAAYPPMRKWFDLLHEKVKVPDHHLHVGDSPDNYFLTPDVLAEGDRLFDQAERLAQGDLDASYYVAKSRMCLRYVEVVRKPDRKAFLDLIGDLRRFDVTEVREGQPVHLWEQRMRERVK